MVIPSLTIEFYRERIEDNLAWVRYLAKDVGEMNRIRGTLPHDAWEEEELIRWIIFEGNQILKSLREEIAYDRKRIEELEDERREAESPEGV